MPIIIDAIRNPKAFSVIVRTFTAEIPVSSPCLEASIKPVTTAKIMSPRISSITAAPKTILASGV